MFEAERHRHRVRIRGRQQASWDAPRSPQMPEMSPGWSKLGLGHSNQVYNCGARVTQLLGPSPLPTRVCIYMKIESEAEIEPKHHDMGC